MCCNPRLLLLVDGMPPRDEEAKDDDASPSSARPRRSLPISITCSTGPRALTILSERSNDAPSATNEEEDEEEEEGEEEDEDS